VFLAETFYVSVMKQLVVAFGAALVLANVLAMIRKRPVELPEAAGDDGEPAPATLERAPIGRSLVFVAIGLVMVVWGVASIVR